jgi:hypothetical protein
MSHFALSLHLVDMLIGCCPHKSKGVNNVPTNPPNKRRAGVPRYYMLNRHK